MNEENFNLGIRKFLKRVGIGSQREIERVVNKTVEEGRTGSWSFQFHTFLESLDQRSRFP
jgi:hypothetical protein